jgi:hypothetical protein
VTKLIALLHFLLALAGIDIGSTSYSNRIVGNDHDALYSLAHAKDGVARFECKASDSGWCHYTLYPERCAGQADCNLAPLQHFTIARGQTRQIVGLDEFRVCVGIDERKLGADCGPLATTH